MKSTVLLLVGLMRSSAAPAQTRRVPAADRSSIWIIPSFGCSTIGTSAYGWSSIGTSAGILAQFVSKNILTTLGAQFLSPTAHARTSEMTELSLLVGPILHRGTFSAAVSAGIAYVGSPSREAQPRPVVGPSNPSVPVTTSFGVPITAQVMFQMMPFLGFGYRAFANVNRIETFGGMSLTAQVGKLW